MLEVTDNYLGNIDNIYSTLSAQAPPPPGLPQTTPNHPGPYLRPMRRFTSYTVRVGFTVAWFFAASPIKRSVSVNAT